LYGIVLPYRVAGELARRFSAHMTASKLAGYTGRFIVDKKSEQCRWSGTARWLHRGIEIHILRFRMSISAAPPIKPIEQGSGALAAWRKVRFAVPVVEVSEVGMSITPPRPKGDPP
jgi:hypothetical protein